MRTLVGVTVLVEMVDSLEVTWSGLLLTTTSLEEEPERVTPSMFSREGLSQQLWFWTGVMVVSALVLPVCSIHRHN